jgi:hypothetical protein
MVISESICRLCENKDMISVLNLGICPISGQFPSPNEAVESLPLNLACCTNCGLVQLKNRLPIKSLYTNTYGYESHLNRSMATHLINKAKKLQEYYNEYRDADNQVYVDVASNDGTLLSGYKTTGKRITLVGIDPLIGNFDNHYPKDTKKIEDFFLAEKYLAECSELVDILTSISVFYDLDDPLKFASDVYAILKPNGIWHLEQSYCITMLEKNSYDTICHEHLLYLKAKDFKYIFDKIGFKVIDVNLNSINGGSIAITVQKSIGPHVVSFDELVASEVKNGFEKITKYEEFEKRVTLNRSKFLEVIKNYKELGYQIVALGASTKGNTILNFCDLNFTTISKIGDVNPKKFGKVTPGTRIPIIDEEEILNSSEKTLAVILPWHFRDTFIGKTENFRKNGNVVVFPLPEVEILE